MFLAFSSFDFFVLDEKYVSTMAAALKSEDDELNSLVLEIKAGKLFRGDRFCWFSLPEASVLEDDACGSGGELSVAFDFNCCSDDCSAGCWVPSCCGPASWSSCGSGVNGRLFT